MSPALQRHGATLALIVAAAAAGVALFVERGAETTTESLARKKNLLPVFRGDDVTELRIASHGRDARVFRGVTNDAGQRPWQIEIGGARYPAEEAAVDQLLGSLRDGVTERKKMGDATADERKSFGLDAPSREITIAMGAQHYRLRFGGPASTPPGARWIEVEGRYAAVVTAQLAAALEVEPDALREKALVAWEASDLDAIALDGEGGARHLVRAPWQVSRGAGFRFDGSTPEGSVRASAAALDHVWDGLGRIKADAFLDADAAEKALRRAITVTLSPHGAKRVTIDLGGECPGHPDDVVAVRRDEGARSVAACVARGAIDALSVPAEELVDRRLVGARVDEVIDVKLEEGAKSIALARTGAQWHEQVPVDRPIDADVGRAFLERILDVEASSFATSTDRAALGLDPPRATARVASAIGDGNADRIELLEIGVEKGGLVNVRRVEDGAIAIVSKDAADALLPNDIALRPKRVLDLAAADVRALRIAGPRGVQRFERSASGAWSLVEPRGDGLSPDVALISELTEMLAALSAERWVGDARPEQGLDHPRIVISAEVGSGKGVRNVEVALGAPTGSGSFAKASRDPAVFVATKRLEVAADRWLLDRTALLVDVEHITRATFSADGKRVALEQHGGALAFAGVAADAETTARAASVRDALGDLMAESVISIGAPEKAQGFDKPTLSMAIEAAGKKIDLRFGSTDTFRGARVIFARRDGVAATFAVAETRVRRLLDALR